MELAKIWRPRSEAELASVICLLHLEGIPHFVHGAGFGSAWPGPQIDAYNARTVMVPAALYERAQAVLAPLQSEESEPATVSGSFPRLRIAIEAFFLGWFVPSRVPGGADGT